MASVSPTGSDPLTSLLNALGGAGSGTGGTSSTGGAGAQGTTPSPPPGSGLLSAPGIGSGLDVNTLVTELVNAEIAPAQNQINSQQATLNAQTSALGNLKSLLSGVQSSLAGLANGSAFTQYTATSSNSAAFSATTGTGAVPGTYQIQVQQLAAAQKLTSGAFASGASVGTGTLTLSVGSQSINVTIDASNNTLAGIRDAINNAPGNPGVSATIVHAADGDHLVLTADQTGVANAASISASGGDGGLAGLTWDAASATGGMTRQTAAADARVSIDGFTTTSSSNVITGALDGVTLNLAGLSASGATDTLSVGRNIASIQGSIQAFVTAYNNFVQGAGQLASYDSTTQTAGPLLGDATLMAIRSQLAMTLTGTAGSNGASGFNTLAAIGISLQGDGTLQLDTGKLGTALANQPDQVAALFGGASGYASKLNTQLGAYLGYGGLLDSRNQSLSNQSQQLATQQAQLNQRQQAIQQRYMAQFTALDTLMAQMNQTSSFLTSQLSMLSAMYQPQSK